MEIKLKNLKLVRRKLKPRGSPKALGQYQFKKGYDPRREGGGRPAGLKRFGEMYVEQLLQVVSDKEAKEFGLKPGATQFQCLIKGMLNAAKRGDTTAVKEIREVLEGKLVTPYISASVHAELESSGALQEAEEALLRLIEQRKQGAAVVPPTIDAPQPAPLPAAPAPKAKRKSKVGP